MQGLVPPEIEQYAEAHTAPLPPLLAELVAETQAKFADRAQMLCGKLEGRFLQTLVAMSGARRVLEVGTFTGFSALMMAEALPADGELVTLELDPRHAALARTYFARSEHGRKITLIEGPALESLRGLRGPFDFAFIDANKTGYIEYYEAALPLMSERGVIAADNTLREGKSLAPQDENDRAIAAFNERVSRDERVLPVMLTVRDGVTLIRKR